MSNVEQDAEQDVEIGRMIRDMLIDWERRGIVDPGWDVTWDAGDGAHRTTMNVCSWGGQVRYYSFSEAELCQYVIALADLAPLTPGQAALALADASREETLPPAGGAR